jgi:hypothetical protein
MSLNASCDRFHSTIKIFIGLIESHDEEDSFYEDTYIDEVNRLITLVFFVPGTIHILSDDLLWSVSSYGEMLWSIELPTK